MKWVVKLSMVFGAFFSLASFAEEMTIDTKSKSQWVIKNPTWNGYSIHEKVTPDQLCRSFQAGSYIQYEFVKKLATKNQSVVIKLSNDLYASLKQSDRKSYQNLGNKPNRIYQKIICNTPSRESVTDFLAQDIKAARTRESLTEHQLLVLKQMEALNNGFNDEDY